MVHEIYHLDGLDDDSPYKQSIDPAYQPFIINPADVPIIPTDVDPFIIQQIIDERKRKDNPTQPQLPLEDIPTAPQQTPKSDPPKTEITFEMSV